MPSILETTLPTMSLCNSLCHYMAAILLISAGDFSSGLPLMLMISTTTNTSSRRSSLRFASLLPPNIAWLDR